MGNNSKIFSGSEIIDLCESFIDVHRALKTIGEIFNEFNFDNENGNAFQGNVQKSWLKSIIDEIILTQFEKLNHIVEMYNQEQSKL
ncbi:MAG: hypothetical protein GY795_12385 [Desulfobacterales bacterium]|nr:hypothetical protein [Desulfobacterales bacterium]